jgi:hypothetical protein
MMNNIHANMNQVSEYQPWERPALYQQHLENKEKVASHTDRYRLIAERDTENWNRIGPQQKGCLMKGNGEQL